MKKIQIDSQLCKQCRGRCCQGHPGVWCDPQRFFDIFCTGHIPTAAQFSEILQQQRLTLRNLDGVLIPAPRATDQGCAAHHINGCRFATSERPGQCLALTPNVETLLDDQIHCTMPPESGSQAARNNWRPFQPLLKQVQLKQQ